MEQLLNNHIEHVMCVLVGLGRIGDLLTTWLASPSLKLESNPLAKKLGWPFMILASVLLCAAPYLSLEVGVVVVVVSLWLAAQNVLKIWVIRAVGEDEYAAFTARAIRAGTLRGALVCVCAHALLLVLMGSVLCVLSLSAYPQLAFWFGIGILAVAVLVAYIGAATLIVRFRKGGTQQDFAGTPDSQDRSAGARTSAASRPLNATADAQTDRQRGE